MTTSIFNKSLVNTIVHLVPTGNNVRRGKENGGAFNQVTTAKVIKVAKINITLLLDGARFESKHRIHDCQPNRVIDGCNSGYEVYLSAQDVSDEQHRLIVKRNLSQHGFELTASQAKEISKIMGW
jgi:hypothetical protein